MPYVGNKPEVGNFRKCDAITTSATATYNLLVGGVAVNPNQNQCIVSLNGVIQSSGTSYTIASSQITFASALTSSDVIDFILILGDTLNVGTVSDDTIGLAQLSATGTASSSTYLRGDNSWATAGGDLSFGGDTFGADKTVGANDAYAFSLETSGNTAIKMDANGHVTMPLQSGFSVTKSTSSQSVSAAYVDVIFNNEIWDTNADWDGTSTFTAPVTGKYLLTGAMRIDSILSQGGSVFGRIGTSNRNYLFGTVTDADDVFNATTTNYQFQQSVVADMDASDTATLAFFSNFATTIYNDAERTYFQGYLLG